MHPKFLPLLCSPKTGAALVLKDEQLDASGNILVGLLVSVDGTESFPIHGGIPRFVEQEAYTASFGYEWKRWPRLQFEVENKGQVMEGFTDRMFQTVTQFTREEVQDKFVVEFGAGPGRFLDRVMALGGLAVGLELSQAADVAFENFKDQQDRVCIVQGDILQPPFKPGAFDHGYTIGVLHHTPNPALAFEQFANVIKPGGKVACRVYARSGLYAFPIVRWMRFKHRWLERIIGKSATRRIYKAYAHGSAQIAYPVLNIIRKFPLLGRYVSAFAERFLVVNVNMPEPRWRMLDVFDASTPFYASTHTKDEIEGWYKRAGMSDPRLVKGENTFIGIK